jgi:nitronate monooxygenase
MVQALPLIIQGGMGVGVSDWRLAGAVSSLGQLGVVSGTALDTILERRLQLGDPGGHMRRALSSFPIPSVAERILDKYLIPEGKPPWARFRRGPMPSVDGSRDLDDLLVAANFVEVYLAREGHDGPVGINYLEKIQAPTLPSLYGAMLAGVDYVLMGAGIPRAIPAILDRLAQGLPVELRLDVKGAGGDAATTHFDPVAFTGGRLPEVKRPAFVAIVSSHTLALVLVRKVDSPVDGFVVEGPTAGGHNAPPRGAQTPAADGQPVYGDRDVPDLAAIRELGRPFWLAGSYAEPEKIAEAIHMGAAGVQVGTAFAFCEESGLAAGLKRKVLDLCRRGMARVFTDRIASPTGFPFKVINLDHTLSEASTYHDRRRVCDLGYLRTAYRQDDGTIGWRCPSEPVGDYLRKGGSAQDTASRRCLCNALMADIGLGQIRRGGEPEIPLLTSGDDLERLARFLPPGAESYRAADVIRYLLPKA